MLLLLVVDEGVAVVSLLRQLLEQEDGDGVDSECIQNFAARSLRFLLLRRISSSDTFSVFFSLMLLFSWLSLTTSDDAVDDEILVGEVDDEGKDENMVGRQVSVLVVVVVVVELPLLSCGVLLLLLPNNSKEASSCIEPIEGRTLNTLDRFGC